MIVWQGVVPGKKAYRVRDWRGGGAGLPAFCGEAGAEAEPRKARWKNSLIVSKESCLSPCCITI